ncbi:ATP-binding cassette domain-containing protein [Actinocrinis puniceicyclus]|uniref:ATP-binding cassette domain-containing protein n=1 Tax=Actinocrinis puniceicyclus TaxID=977794 RepID=A0A8J7WRE9_9ACTN|nr:ATP-binding cassette domain-containing protein [Actinocrinis puniceicyclus]MBS2965067.1 ATP-binding cassette domain-containing protein [Actinocrinis puniceicyclus]
MNVAPTAALWVDGIAAGYRGVPVLRGVSFEVAPGRVLGLVGPNGAGKSTLLDVVCGTLRPTAGRVWLFGRDITRLPVHRRARLGLGRTFQRLEPFTSLNIADNLLVAAEFGTRGTPPERLGRFRPRGPDVEAAPAGAGGETPAAVAHRLLRRFALVDFAGQPLSAVPTGVARLVEIARAMAAGARVLLLDEPSSGMSETQVLEFAATVRALRADGLSLVLVEHDPGLVAAVCDEVFELAVAADRVPG